MRHLNKKKIKIGIIDLNLNNIQSLINAISRIGYKITIIKNKNKIKNFDIIFLPGIGSFKQGMTRLKKMGLINQIKIFINDRKKKLFGICLGMQLLFEKSTEFNLCKGLGILEGNVVKLRKQKGQKIPNIGWSKVICYNSENVFSKIEKNEYFYFVHSYVCKPKKKNIISLKTKFGSYHFASSIKYKNIWATQFHPEKSSKQGLKLIKRFIEC